MFSFQFSECLVFGVWCLVFGFDLECGAFPPLSLVFDFFATEDTEFTEKNAKKNRTTKNTKVTNKPRSEKTREIQIHGFFDFVPHFVLFVFFEADVLVFSCLYLCELCVLCGKKIKNQRKRRKSAALQIETKHQTPNTKHSEH